MKGFGGQIKKLSRKISNGRGGGKNHSERSDADPHSEHNDEELQENGGSPQRFSSTGKLNEEIEVSKAGTPSVHHNPFEEESEEKNNPFAADEDRNDKDDIADTEDLEDLDQMLDDMDIDKDFQMFSSFRNSMERRTSTKELKSNDTKSGDAATLPSIVEAASPHEELLEQEDLQYWERRLDREEIFSKRYHPTKAEAKELSDLESQLNSKSVFGFLLGNNHKCGYADYPTPEDEAIWKQLLHPQQQHNGSPGKDVPAGPCSILLKRGPILYKTSFDADQAEHEAELILLTHGMAIATVLHSQSGDKTTVTRKLERALDYRSMAFVAPDSVEDTAWQVVVRSAKGQERLSIVSGSVAQQRAWLDAMEIVVINHFIMHEKDEEMMGPRSLGWQYRLIHKPAFTMAVLGMEDDLMIPEGFVNQLDAHNGYSPLHYAVKLKHEKIVQSLLEEEADPNLKDKDGCTPAYYAVQEEAPEGILTLLERFGAQDVQKKKSERSDLFSRVTATKQQRQLRQQKEAAAAQAKMSQNMRLLHERGQKIEQAADKARELNENAAEYGDLARKLKETTKKQASWSLF